MSAGSVNDQLNALAQRMSDTLASLNQYSIGIFADDANIRMDEPAQSTLRSLFIPGVPLPTSMTITAGINARGDTGVNDLFKFWITVNGTIVGLTRIYPAFFNSSSSSTIGVSGLVKAKIDVPANTNVTIQLVCFKESGGAGYRSDGYIDVVQMP